MKVYKFTLNVSNLNNDEKAQMSLDYDFRNLLEDIDKYIGYHRIDENTMIMYLYTEDESIYYKIFDILFDYKMFVDVKDITEEMKFDYAKFQGIDDITNSNYELLINFIYYIYCDDFILDYISINGKEKFDNQITQKFFSVK